MLNRERYPLFQIISDDFINHNKLPVLLLLGIVFTAIGTVWVTHQFWAETITLIWVK